MKKRLFTACVLAVVVSSSFAQDVEIKAARLQVEHGKLKQSIETLQKATATYPAAAQLFYYLGQTQLLVGDKKSAQESFDKGVAADPKQPLNYVGQGEMLLLAKKPVEAKVLFDKAIGMGKKNTATLQSIAKAYLNEKATDKDALPLLERAKELKPEEARTYYLLGDYYSLENNGGSCASAYERAAELDPKSGQPWYNIGMLYQRSKNIPVSEENLKKAIEVDPDFALAHKELAEIYYLKKDGANAVKHQQIYLSLTDSPEADARFKLAFFYFLAKNYVEANKIFKELAEKSDVTSNTLKFYARSLYMANEYEQSRITYEMYMKHPQTKVEADDYQWLGDLFKKQGKDSLAAIAYEKSVDIDPKQNDVHNTLIEYYFTKKRNYTKSIEVLKKAIKGRKTPFYNDFYSLGRAYYIKHSYLQADSAFAKCIELQPKVIIGYTWAARSKSQQDTLLTEGLAKPFYEKVIEVGSATPDKNKNDLIQAYQYMGSYYLVKGDAKTAKEFFEKALALGPDEKQKASIEEAIKHANAALQPQTKPKPKPKS